MSKGLRLSEKWFQRGLWLIAVIFAGFLIGLGSLVVNDLPRVERPVDAEVYMDQGKLAEVRQALRQDSLAFQDNDDALARATRATQKAQQDIQAEREGFQNWIATRTATQQSSQDAEVVSRTQKLDTLKATERGLVQQQQAIEEERDVLHRTKALHLEAERKIRQDGQAGYERAIFRAELRAFLLRLAFTLPLLLISIWLFLHARKGTHWPFVWGFIFFSLFTFFVELVPYLPSYGGYIRYIVGIVLTVLVGNYAIRALRRYLDAQKAEEQKPEVERRKDLSYEAALARLGRRACPGCERPVDPADVSANFCMHCGLLLYENCPRCATRQTVFTHFCRTCGYTKSAPAQEIGGVTAPSTVNPL